MAVRPIEEHPCDLPGNGKLAMCTVHMIYNSDKLGKQIPRGLQSSIIDFVSFSPSQVWIGYNFFCIELYLAFKVRSTFCSDCDNV